MFPIDWNEWQKEWRAWYAEHAAELKRATGRGDKNFLADEVLGTWRIAGRTVELSEVTFPNLSERDAKTGRLVEKRVRYIGITYVDGDTTESGGIVDSFAALEDALHLSEQTQKVR